nr:vesicle-associated membrane protein 3 isoform X2 [Taeniopygia guttata]
MSVCPYVRVCPCVRARPLSPFRCCRCRSRPGRAVPAQRPPAATAPPLQPAGAGPWPGPGPALTPPAPRAPLRSRPSPPSRSRPGSRPSPPRSRPSHIAPVPVLSRSRPSHIAPAPSPPRVPPIAPSPPRDSSARAPRAAPAGPARALPPRPRSRPTARMSANVPGSSNMAAGSNRRLQQTQHQVDEVVDIMRVNVDKVLERDQKLSELDDRADALQAGASQFETSAAKLKRKYWWKNCKMWAILIGVVVIIIVIIILWSAYS